MPELILSKFVEKPSIDATKRAFSRTFDEFGFYQIFFGKIFTKTRKVFMKYMLDKKDIEYIKIYPSDKDYESFKKFRNAEMVNFGTDSEFIVFYTFNKSKLIHTAKFPTK